MLKTIRDKLKRISLLHSIYMRIKRRFGNEILGMTSKTEQDYFFRFGSEIYSGQGEIVDLGSWLGSTTIPLVKGLLKNPLYIESPRKIYAYDLFIWFDWMEPSVIGSNLAGKYKEGDNFVAEFKKRTEKFKSHIEICEGDLTKIGWNKKEIEFLLIDAMKNWELTNSIIKNFYPSLIPGTSLILHQDFGHYFTPWIHLMQWKFREHFEFVEEIPKSQSVVFKYVQQIDNSLLKQTYSFNEFTDEDVDKAFKYSMDLVSDEKKPNIAAAKVMWYIHQNQNEKAKQSFDKLSALGIPEDKDFLLVKNLISNNKI